jgi:hypothetical protein
VGDSEVCFLDQKFSWFSMLALPLTQLTRKRQAFVWDAKCEESFQELKRRLTLATVLILPNPNESFVVYCDDAESSGCGIYVEAFESA